MTPDQSPTPEHGTGAQTAGEQWPQPGAWVRAKWTMDGATTLAEAADRLEAYAAQLRALHTAGWTLAEPIDSDYGQLVDPTGNTGPEEFDETDPGLG